jgi:hypothetical protein
MERRFPSQRPWSMWGGYYKFRDPGFQLLFCYGHTAVGKSENYSYLGLYWTWGKKVDADKPGDPVAGDSSRAHGRDVVGQRAGSGRYRPF